MNKIFAYACRVDAERIIQLGDFGFGWHLKTFRGGPQDAATGYVVPQCDFSHYVGTLVQETGIPLDWLDGNHENHTRLLALPVDDEGFRTIWPGVRHIPRGTLMEYGGVRFLACGGAISVDRNNRKLGTSYWPEEELTPEDVATCKASGKADILLTHDAPLSSHVLDRHLDSRWPRDATDASYINRRLVQQVWDQSEAKIVFHGHIHHSYSERTDQGLIVGLNKCDDPGVDHCTYLFDTDIYRSKESVDRYWAAKVG